MTERVECIRTRIPTGQFVRYLLVGGWNTLFGYSLFAFLTYVLTGVIPFAYMTASILSNIIAITVGYIGYKLFVFRTTGNYLREYLRFYVVYGASAALNLVLLPFLVAGLNLITAEKVYAPYIAGALLTVVTVLVSFFGHRNFSFRP